ncbi:MAG: hypothetical protein AAF743_13770 [Planctomycetota bacterium]
MNKAALDVLLKAKPFVPFRVVMSSGEGYVVRHPELAICTKNFVIVYDPNGERVGHLSYLHIAAANLAEEENTVETV